MNDYDLLSLTPSPTLKQLYRLIRIIPQRLNARHYSECISLAEKGKEYCNVLCLEYRRKGIERSANVTFLLRKYFTLWSSIASYWKMIAERSYYEAWCFLHDGLDTCDYILKYVTNPNQLSILDLRDYLHKYEELFPYNIFMSTGMTIIKMRCSICGLNPLDPKCLHIPGEMSWGEGAYMIIEEAEPHEISLVEHPRDKRCVVDIKYDKNRPENGPFARLFQVTNAIDFPLRNLRLDKESIAVKRDELHILSHWSCPCESGMKFEDCCSGKEEITIPILVHVEILDLLRIEST